MTSDPAASAPASTLTVPATIFAPESTQASTSADALVYTPDTASNSAPATTSDITCHKQPPVHAGQAVQ